MLLLLLLPLLLRGLGQQMAKKQGRCTWVGAAHMHGGGPLIGGSINTIQ